jgi:TRAP-type C4-dicarboxylate transport system permease small subunit
VRKALHALYQSAGVLAAASIFMIFALMIAQALGREIGFQVRGADDLTAWFCAASAFLGLAYTYRKGDFVRVGLWVERLPAYSRRIAEVGCLGAAVISIGYTAWSAGRYMVESWRLSDVAGGQIIIPVWIPQLSLIAGVSILLVALLEDLIDCIRGRLPSYVIAANASRDNADELYAEKP